MREDEGRKLMKPTVLVKLIRVLSALPNGSDEKKWIHSLIQKVRYKQYVLTKSDMHTVNEIFNKVRGS